jgi:hypothetical protein
MIRRWRALDAKLSLPLGERSKGFETIGWGDRAGRTSRCTLTPTALPVILTSICTGRRGRLAW